MVERKIRHLRKGGMLSSELVSKVKLQNMAGCCVGATGPTGAAGSASFTGETGMVSLFNGVGLTGNSEFNYKFIPSGVGTGKLYAVGGTNIIRGIGTTFATELKRGEPIVTTSGKILPIIDQILDTDMIRLLTIVEALEETTFYTAPHNQVTVNADIFPSKDDYYSLGSAERRWDKLCVGPACLDITNMAGDVHCAIRMDETKIPNVLETNLSFEAPSFYVGTADGENGWIIGKTSENQLIATEWNGNTGTNVYPLITEMQNGVVDAGNSEAGTVEFKKPFRSIPVVQLTQQSTGAIIPLCLTGVSTTQFSWQSGSSGVGFIHWSASVQTP